MEQDISHTESSKTDKANYLIERIDDYEPIVIIKQTTDNDRDIYFAALGDAKICPDYETVDEVRSYIEEKSWNLIITVMIYIMEKSKQINKEDNKY